MHILHNFEFCSASLLDKFQNRAQSAPAVKASGCNTFIMESVNITSMHTMNQIEEFHPDNMKNIRLISFIKLKTKVYIIILTYLIVFQFFRVLDELWYILGIFLLKTIRHIVIKFIHSDNTVGF